MSKVVILIGTHRKEGNTVQLVRAFQKCCPSNIIDLAEASLENYRYDQSYEGDNFLSIIDAMIDADTLVMATPVYWYAMSSVMKCFFDRLSDLLSSQKERGRALKGKRMFLLVSGHDAELPPGFTAPFSCTASYFDMSYEGALYRCEADPQSAQDELQSFAARVTHGELREEGVFELRSEADWKQAAMVLQALRPSLDVNRLLSLRTRLQTNGYRLFGLYEEGELCTIGGVSIHPHVERVQDLWVHDLVTLPEFRSKGYGEKMMRFLESIAEKETGHALSVYTRVNRERAIHFYEERLGYFKTSLLFKSE